MSAARPLAVFDPHPRTLPLLFDAATQRRLESLCELAIPDRSPAPADWLDRHLERATFLIGQSALPKERLDRSPQLRAVFNVEGNFLPNIDYAECQRRGITVLGTGPVFAQPVAEMALGMALSCARRMHEADAAIRAGRESLYGEGDNHDSILLSGRTMALVGCGAVGRALVPLLRPFRGPLLAHDPWLPAQVIRNLGAEPVGLADCFERATVVFLLAAATTENAGAIGRSLLDRLPPHAIVILASRAGIVNFDDLLAAAAAGRIRAAIDVWPEEPIPARHPARSTPNTLLQAHRAGNIPEIWPEMGRMVADDIELLLRGLAPQRCQPARLETVTRMRSKPVSA